MFPRKSFKFEYFWSKRARGVTTWYQSFGLSELGFHYRLPSLKPLVEALDVSVSRAEIDCYVLDELCFMLVEPIDDR